MQVTVETKLKDQAVYPLFEAIAGLVGRVKRRLFVERYVHGRLLKVCKRDFLVRFGLTARWFNAIAINLQNEVGTARRNVHKRVTTLIRQEQAVRQTMARLTRRLTNRRHPPRDPQELRFMLHQKKRRLFHLRAALDQARSEAARRIPPLCFGGRRLFRAQFHPAENGYRSHEEWRKDWRTARSLQFLCLGSSDEKGGNQTCTLSLDGTLRLLVPDALVPQFGRWITLRNIRFSCGQDVIDQALLVGQALTYRFIRRIRKEKAIWYLQVTVDRPEVPILTSRTNGALGVDLNPHRVAWGRIDWYGNPVACVGISRSSSREGGMSRSRRRWGTWWPGWLIWRRSSRSPSSSKPWILNSRKPS